MELWTWSFSGVPRTEAELRSLFAEGLLSADRDTLKSVGCATSCWCMLATFPFPLSPELVRPLSLINLEDRPLLLSSGISFTVFPGLRLSILCSSLAARFSCLRLTVFVPSLCVRASLFDFSVHKDLTPLSWDCLSDFTRHLHSSILLVLLLLCLVESTPQLGWSGSRPR